MNDTSFVELFRQLNRKERYWLVRDVLGQTSKHLGDEFRVKVENVLREAGKSITIPYDAEWAIDYHIDSIVALLRLHGRKLLSTTSNNDRVLDFCNACDEIEGNHQDFDLVIAFDNNLILVEVKCMGNWSNSQLNSKIERLNLLSHGPCNLINPETGVASGIQLNLILCSPAPPQKIKKLSEWPKWILKENNQPIWMHLTLPNAKTHFQVITRDVNKRRWKLNHPSKSIQSI